MINLENEVALITGASRGIGAELAKTFAACGCKVVVNFKTSQEKAEAVGAQIDQAGGQALLVQADITNPDQVTRMVEICVEQFGTPSILVNNASGPIISKKIAKTNWDEFVSTFESSVKSAFTCTAAVSPLMRKQKRGKILNIVTQYAQGVPPIAMATYVTAKYALVGFSKSLAVELAPFGIQVNMLSPGLTETDLTSHLPKSTIEAAAQQTPLKRNTKVTDISQAALFLVSNMSNYLTGINLPVCGGNLM